MKLHTILASGILGAALSGACWADTVYLKDGTEVEGTVLEENANTVVIKKANGVTRSFRRDDVDLVTRTPRTKLEAIDAKPAGPAPGAPEAAGGTGPKGPEGKTIGAQPDGAKTDEKKTGDKTDKGDKEKTGDKEKEEDDESKWSPPPGLESFPDHAKRMPADKEKIFMDALERLTDASTAPQAKADIQGLGKDALPYVVAGLQHVSVFARTACMQMVPDMEGNRAVKQTIEAFYAAMPADGRAASFQTPYIDAIKVTLPALTGQTFVSVESRSPLVQQGLKQYIDWYNTNVMTLPPQLGEKKVSKTDPDYMKKITESRQLKLVKREWPTPAGGQDDLQKGGRDNGGRPQFDAKNTTREADKDYIKSIPKTDAKDPFKRPNDKDQ